MAKGAQIELLTAGVTDDSGNPLSAGKVYTYDAGTTTPKSLYTDVGLTSAAANPVILGSNGKAVVYGNGNYKFVIKTSADATLYTFDYLTYLPLDGWIAWVPTLTTGTAMTIASLSVLSCQYHRTGTNINIRLRLSFSVGGTPNNRIYISLPSGLPWVYGQTIAGTGYFEAGSSFAFCFVRTDVGGDTGLLELYYVNPLTSTIGNFLAGAQTIDILGSYQTPNF